jgi:hypothetical protein
MRARFRTLHTYSGDIWHLTVSARDDGGNLVGTLLQTDSERIRADGWHPWEVKFRFDPAWYQRITKLKFHDAC